LGGAWVHPTPICLHFQTWRYDPDEDKDVNLARMRDAILEAMEKADHLRRRQLAVGRGRFLFRIL
jgi:hypothetical protein